MAKKKKGKKKAVRLKRTAKHTAKRVPHHKRKKKSTKRRRTHTAAAAPEHTAPKKKRKSRKGKGRRKSKGKRAKTRSATRSSTLENALKTGAKVAAGAVLGLLLAKTGMIPAEVSGPAVGIAIAGIVDKGHLAMPAATFLTGAVGFQVFHSFTEVGQPGYELFTKLEEKVINAFGPTVASNAGQPNQLGS